MKHPIFELLDDFHFLRGFIRLVERLGDDLRFMQHIPRALGLKLSAMLDERPEVAVQIRAALKGFDNRSVTDELEILRRAAGLTDAPDDDAAPLWAALLPAVAELLPATAELLPKSPPAELLCGNTGSTDWMRCPGSTASFSKLFSKVSIDAKS